MQAADHDREKINPDILLEIFLDKITSAYQTKALIKLIQEYLGKQRLPMLIIDHAKVVTDRTLFSARGAGILGLSNFGRDHTYLLNDDMQIDVKALEEFMEKYQSSPIFIFGFTFMVWQYFYQPLLQGNQVLNIPNATLIHSGGWKKLLDQAVDNRLFKAKLNKLNPVVLRAVAVGPNKNIWHVSNGKDELIKAISTDGSTFQMSVYIGLLDGKLKIIR